MKFRTQPAETLYIRLILKVFLLLGVFRVCKVIDELPGLVESTLETLLAIADGS